MTERGATGGEEAAEDRRDSKRVPVRLLVRDLGVGGSFEERSGNLALGGVYFTEGHPPVGNRVEVRFRIPGSDEELRATGRVLRITRGGGAFGAHVRFEELPLAQELALARWLEGA